jgi:hypothetical protein
VTRRGPRPILTRDAGSDNDGLADSLSLVFTDKK